MNQRAVAAICLSIFGAAMLIICGLWPVTDWASVLSGVVGWSAFAQAARLIFMMDEAPRERER